MTTRQPKGTPVGGQFAEDRKPDGIDLATHVMPEGFSAVSYDQVNGTSLVGNVETTYAKLVQVFGPPQFDDESDDRDKSTAMWYLDTPAGVATIYDFDDRDQRPLEEFAWHIGGEGRGDVVSEIRQVLGQFGAFDGAHFDFGNGPVPARQHVNGKGWVANTAFVENSAFVGQDAKVCDAAEVTANARVTGQSIISGDAIVTDNALVHDSTVQDHAVVAKEARVLNKSVVRENASVSGFATVSDGSDIYGSAKVFQHAGVFDGATVGDEARISGHASLHGPHAHLYGPAEISGYEHYDLIG